MAVPVRECVLRVSAAGLAAPVLAEAMRALVTLVAPVLAVVSEPPDGVRVHVALNDADEAGTLIQALGTSSAPASPLPRDLRRR